MSRHSLLSYALLSIPIAGAVSQLYSGSRLRGYIGSLLALSFLTNLCLPLYFGGERLPVFLGFESAQAYFDRKYTIWEKSFFVEYINGRIPEGAGILFVNCQAPELHYPRHRIFCMDLFDKYFYRVTPSAAVVELDKYGIEYFVVAGSSVNRSDSGMVYYTGPDGETPIRWFPAASGELLVTHDNVSLYKRVKTVGTTPENKYLKTL